MPKTHTHLSLEERALMQVWLELRRSPSTITREFARNHGRLPEASMAPRPERPPMAGGYRCAHAQACAQRLAKKPRVARKMVNANANAEDRTNLGDYCLLL